MRNDCLTLGEAAARLGAREWQLRRLFTRGLLPPAARAGRFRVFTEADLPKLERALRRAGYLEAQPATA